MVKHLRLYMPHMPLALGLLLWLDVPAGASNRSGEGTVPSRGIVVQSANPVAEQRPPITVELPIGQVSISGVGDQLGEIRYGQRDGSQSSVVMFTKTRVTALPSNSGYRGLPTGLPVDGAVLTSGFGLRRHPISGLYRKHGGVDLAAPRGTPVKATMDGVVTVSGWVGGYGIMVKIDHGSGMETRYAHMSRALVNSGQRISQGQLIGLVGSTGRSTGPHVHYEVRSDRIAVNPIR